MGSPDFARDILDCINEYAPSPFAQEFAETIERILDAWEDDDLCDRFDEGDVALVAIALATLNHSRPAAWRGGS